MTRTNQSLAMWLRVATIASLSWPLSFSLVAILLKTLRLDHSDLALLLLLSTLVGLASAFTSWIAVRDFVRDVSVWVLTNVLGVMAALLTATRVLTWNGAATGQFTAGLVAGAICGSLQSLGLRQGESRIGPVAIGALSWALAILLGGWLSGSVGADLQGAAGHGLLAALVIGWSVAGGLLVLAMIALAPVPRGEHMRGQADWWV